MTLPLGSYKGWFSMAVSSGVESGMVGTLVLERCALGGDKVTPLDAATSDFRELFPAFRKALYFGLQLADPAFEQLLTGPAKRFEGERQFLPETQGSLVGIRVNVAHWGAS